jgi:Uncharacterized protein conserved in bacteria
MGGLGTEHGYGSAITNGWRVVKKNLKFYTDWPWTKKRKKLFEGRDLNSTIDSRAVYNSANVNLF